MQINVSVDGLDGIDLNTVIGDEIAHYDEETGVTEYRGKTLGDLVAEKLAVRLFGQIDDRRDLARDARNMRVEIVREKVAPVIEAALSGPIQLTNSFGEPTGPTTTLTELIIAEAKKVTTSGQGHYGREPSILNKVVAEQVGNAFKKELNDLIAAEKEKTVNAVRAAAATLVADAIKRGLGDR